MPISMFAIHLMSIRRLFISDDISSNINVTHLWHQRRNGTNVYFKQKSGTKVDFEQTQFCLLQPPTHYRQLSCQFILIFWTTHPSIHPPSSPGLRAIRILQQFDIPQSILFIFTFLHLKHQQSMYSSHAQRSHLYSYIFFSEDVAEGSEASWNKLPKRNGSNQHQNKQENKKYTSNFLCTF